VSMDGFDRAVFVFFLTVITIVLYRILMAVS
jgi:hypothetical protein